jgi:hypothetical protein
MVLSGGDTMFEIAQFFNMLSAIDINQEQINIVKQKISLMNTNEYKPFLDTIECVFDNFFPLINGMFNL